MTAGDAGTMLRQLAAEIPGLTEGRSRVGDPAHVAWFAGRREVAHLHSERLLDVRLPPSVQRELKGDPRAVFRPRRSQWMEYELRDDEDVRRAVELVRRAAEIAASP